MGRNAHTWDPWMMYEMHQEGGFTEFPRYSEVKKELLDRIRPKRNAAL